MTWFTAHGNHSTIGLFAKGLPSGFCKNVSMRATMMIK